MADNETTIEDPDGDGQTNAEEYLTDTDPIDTESFQCIAGSVSVDGFSVSFTSSAD